MKPIKFTLLPCPFCGSDELSFYAETQTAYRLSENAQVCCDSCGVFGPVASDTTDQFAKIKAIGLWNKRTVPPDEEAEK